MGAIVGRRSELERVERFLGAVEGGVHGLLLEGEPGIGKTRIWAEGLERARARG